jgi:hypothetical protein
MRSRFTRTIGTLLGLLAILMASLAPTVSQTLAASHHEHATADMDCSMPEMQHAPAGKSHDGTSMSDGQACGYCGLFAHMPTVPIAQSRFALTVEAIVHQAATRFESVRLVARVSPSQPRAPPVLS